MGIAAGIIKVIVRKRSRKLGKNCPLSKKDNNKKFG